MDAFEDPEQALKDFIGRQKMGRLGTAEEIAGAVMFLSSKDVSTTSLFFGVQASSAGVPLVL